MFNSIWRKKPQKRSHRPWVEALEDRCVPTTSVTDFALPTAGAAPGGITMGPDGNVWFTETQANQIGVMNPSTHAISEFAIPTAGSGPTGITTGPDGNLWFTEESAGKIGTINPTTHKVTEYALPNTGNQPFAIAAGADGNLWFTEVSGNNIGMISPSGTITEYGLPTANSSPEGIAAGPDGNLWFTEHTNNKVAMINPFGGAITEYAIPSSASQPIGITPGPNNTMWFTENNTNRIAKISTTSETTAHPGIIEYAIPTAKSGPAGIVAGPDGNLWYVEANANKIGTLIVTSGVATETNIPTSSAATAMAGITATPGGTLWFTEKNANKIGEVVSPPLITATPINASVSVGGTATFLAAAAVGLPPPTAQWLVSTDGGLTYTPIANGPTATGATYSGATTGTLTITNVTSTMTGYEYEAVFTNNISSATTAPATLTVTNALSISPTQLPQGTPNTPYNQTISVVGSTSPFTLFSVNNFNAGGTGLSLANVTTNSINGTITISGTPLAAGTATFTIAVANSAGNSLTQNMTLTISPPLSIGTASLPTATAGVMYSQAINIIGGAMPYAVFTVANFNGGTTGLTASNITTVPTIGTFNVSGMPTGAGVVSFTVNVTDAGGAAVTRDYSILVNPAFVITPSLPQGTAGTHYHQVLTVTGGGTPYTSVTIAGLNTGSTGLTPANFAINAAAGTITIDGTPNAGIFSFIANVVDSGGSTLTKAYSVTVNPSLAITPTLPQGTAGAAYHQTINVTGGTTPYTTFTVTGLSAGGTGLTVAAITANAATGTVVVNGTPTGAGTLSFTVNVTDSAGSSLTRIFSILINPPIAVGDITNSQWSVGTPGYPGVLTMTGGTGTLILVSATGLPNGLNAVRNGNTISFTGTPTTAGTFANATVTIHDSAGASFTKKFTITINSAPTIGSLTASQWTVGQSGFDGTIAVAGGTGGLSIYSVTGLPKGMSIVLTGNKIAFTGTPTSAGTFAGSVTIRDAIGAAVTKTFSLTINADPAVGNLSVTQWTKGQANFTGTMTIAAGTGPFTITGVSGLPTGMTAVLSGNTVRFVGTPTTVQTFASGSITIKDAAGATVTKTFSITINPSVQITTTSFPPTSMGLLYSASVHAVGGTGAVTYSLTAGSLPPGIKISSNGIITGLSRSMGTYSFTITATDATGAKVSEKYTLTLRRR